jgi:serine/threonine protein phosphatase 1
VRILAIGDIHGCSQAFDALLAAVCPSPEDLIVTLGDYVDRGPDSHGVLGRLLQLQRDLRLYALRGNHEQMMLEARENPDVFSSWLISGGLATLISYGKGTSPGELSDVPESHWDFLEGCVDWFETERHIFVHANADPYLHMEEQPLLQLLWAKFDSPPPHRSGKTMVCGHTRQLSGWPLNMGHAVCIDTWAYGDGWLTCLDCLSGKFWQANQDRCLREGWLNELLVRQPA